MKNLKRNLIGLFLTLTAIIGLFLTMNESADYVNFAGLLIFGLSCLLGALHARYELIIIFRRRNHD